MSFQTLLGTRAGQALKQPLRAVAARAGYDLIPTERDENLRFRNLLITTGVDTVIDVGANQGQFASHMRTMGFRGPIISFEPGAAAYRLLARHATKDSLWDVRQYALGARAVEAPLNVAYNSVSSSLYEVADDHIAAAPSSATKLVETVQVRRLDDEISGLNVDCWLKIDTQGYEMQVLLGAEETLRRTRLLQLEISFAHLYEGQPDWLEMMYYIKRRGFVIIDILPGFRSTTGNLLQCDVVALRQ